MLKKNENNQVEAVNIPIGTTTIVVDLASYTKLTIQPSGSMEGAIIKCDEKKVEIKKPDNSDQCNECYNYAMDCSEKSVDITLPVPAAVSAY